MKYLKNFENNNTSYFYRIDGRDFLICDIDTCGESEHTFDIKFFDFAENIEL
jgi:hypothetical protein